MRCPDVISENDSELENTDQVSEEESEETMTVESALTSLKGIRKLCVNDAHLFQLSQQLYTGLQKKVLKKELTCKTKQTSIKSFLK